MKAIVFVSRKGGAGRRNKALDITSRASFRRATFPACDLIDAVVWFAPAFRSNLPESVQTLSMAT